MESKFFDVHTHLNMQFGNDWREVGKRTLEAGISFVNVGADEKSSILALEQAEYFEGLKLPAVAKATAGIHPTEGGDSDFSVIAKLAKNKNVVAIGECGLEYFRIEDEQAKKIQRELFKKHIELALKVEKPLMIHCRSSAFDRPDAHNDTWEILNEYKQKVGDKLRFDMHFFTGDWVMAQKFLDLGGYLSFNGVITFADQYNEVVKNMPLDRILAETDAPFVTPIPFRGKRNEPAYVALVAEKIACLRRQASLRSEPKEEVFRVLVKNAQEFYSLVGV